MVGVVVGEIDPPAADTERNSAVRQRILSARRALLRHPWAFRVIASLPLARAVGAPRTTLNRCTGYT